MGQRSKRAARCATCRMHEAECLCAAIPRLELATRVVVVMHRREAQKPTATARLALLALPGSQLAIHGHDDARLDLRHLHDGGRRVLALFPADDARPLGAGLLAADPRPITLVVPDGSWRQASKAVRRIPGLAEAERVSLPAGAPSGYRLRREPRTGGLATFEAIARALGIIESPAVEVTLSALFERMVSATLRTRGAPPPGQTGH